ncbi:hypothetical protein LTR24_007214 [Lithohypha guttulata]|uniref:Uncharacterized protein n=1 Tax=Lithohypha guttulata TaxID=1690604 RepID=A0ABR0K3H9_9EURO|nr:hypothetical protein LTR24_007214 [Lithohypha guttulata]
MVNDPANTLLHIQRSAMLLEVGGAPVNEAQGKIGELARREREGKSDDKSWSTLAREAGKAWIKKTGMYIQEQMGK